MSKRRAKALEDARSKYDAHVGHTLTMVDRVQGVLVRTSFNEYESLEVWIRVEGDKFLRNYFAEAVRKCDCGEGDK